MRSSTDSCGSSALGCDSSGGLAIPDFLDALENDDSCAGPAVRSLGAARRRSIVADDDMSSEEADVAPLSGMSARMRAAPMHVIPEPTKAAAQPVKPAQALAQGDAGKPIAAQVSECKAMIAQLQQFKDQKLQQEDYMGAHHVKQMIQEQEQKLQQLRQQLDGMPTPARLAASPGVGQGGRRGPRVSISVGPKRKREKSPTTLGAGPNPGEAAAPLSLMERMMKATASKPVTGEPAHVEAAKQDVAPVEVDDDEEMPEAGTEAQDEPAGQEEGGEVVEDGEEELEAGQWRSCPGRPELVELPSEKQEMAPFTLPRDIFERLYPYQRAGVAWMARIFQSQQGGILADEMGLGKTIQVCALLNGARKAGATHALLLMPVTLLDQWAKEARIWCPGWPVYTYYGSQAQRLQALRRVQRPEGGLLLTSYSMIGYTEDLFDISVDDAPSPKPARKGGKGRGRGSAGGPKGGKRRRLDDDEGWDECPVSEEERVEPEVPACGLPRTGATRPWDVVVCDEAHRMKNISTLLGKSLRRLTSRSRILLTGTPVQNALQDLWALLDFAQPGLLGNHATFVKTFSEPIDRGSVRGAKVWAVELKNHLAAQLRALISPHLLRRTKAGAGLMAAENEGVATNDECGTAPMPICDGSTEGAMEDTVQDIQIAKLPPKKETIIWLEPSEEQMFAYQKVLEKSEVIREAVTKQKLGIEVFRAIGLLKRLCNHPMLLLPTAKPGDWAQILADCQKEADDQVVVPSEAVAENLGGAAAETSDDARAGRAAEMMLRKLPRSMEALRQQGAKLRCLSALLPALAAKGHRTLVFSGSVKMLDLIQICCLRPNGLPCLRIDGGTDAFARAEKVAKFQREQSRFKCMLLTTNVGGVGLNLTSADRVVLVDPAWNPATDAQAVDRAFRIGQDKEVRVYRLIMSGLIEDKMFRLQVFKMGLTKTALEAGHQHTYFTAREIRALFDWTDPQEGETRKLLVEKHGAERDQAIMDAAEEDGSAEGWYAAGPAVALSDFSAVYGCVAQEEEKDENCEAQVAEAKLKLGAADEKLQSMQEARKAAELHSEKVANDLKEAIAMLEQLREKRVKLEEALKKARGEATQACRSEVNAQQRLEKTTRNCSWAQDQHQSKLRTREDACKVAEIAASSVSDAAASARSQEEGINKALVEVEGQLSAFDDSGRAAREGPVDAAVDRLRKAHKAVDKMRTALEQAATKQAEVDAADAELAQAETGVAEAQAAMSKLGEPEGEETDAQAAAARKAAEVTHKNKDKDRTRAELSFAKAQSKVDAAREALVSAAQGLSEAGVALAESFKKTEARPVKMDKVKEAQANAKACFRQISSAATAAKKARELWSKAVSSRRRAQQKGFAAMVAEAEAEACLAGYEKEQAEASAQDKARREERAAREAELAKAEAARSAAEVEEAETKRKRDELKAAKPGALESVKSARAAEKEAASERQALHQQCSKVEKAHQDLETAKNSAVQTLMAETYDAKQVEQAYENKKKASE